MSLIKHLQNEDSSLNFGLNINKTKENTFFTSNSISDKPLTSEGTQHDFLNPKNDDKEIDKKKISAVAALSETLRYDPKLKRRNMQEDYEKPMSKREEWWRVTIKDTPLPVAYETTKNNFIDEITKKPNTYSFKSDGRKLNPTPQIGKGEYLMPGAYQVEDLTDKLAKLKVTYGFKGPQREAVIEKSMFGSADKNIQVSPDTYETEKYNRISAEIENVRHAFFKSKTRRKVFPPKEGPPPGCYEIISLKPKSISSCFRSKSSRFVKSQTLTPGPGAYWPLSQWPVSKNVEKLGEKGVYFTPNFKAEI